MENQEIRRDDYLGDLIRKLPLESPSEDFVEKIMATVNTREQAIAEKQSYYHYFRSALPFAALVLFCILIVATSDMPFLGNLMWENPLRGIFGQYISEIFDAILVTLNIRYISWGLLVSGGIGFLYLVDRFFSRRTAV